MGGDKRSTEVDLTALRAVADRVSEAADAIAEIRWPASPTELPGSAVGAVAVPDLVAAELADVIAAIRGWAADGRMSADAFARADQGGADRFGRP